MDLFDVLLLQELHDIGFADSKQAAPACLIKLSGIWKNQISAIFSLYEIFDQLNFAVINLKGAPIFASHLDKLVSLLKIQFILSFFLFPHSQ